MQKLTTLAQTILPCFKKMKKSPREDDVRGADSYNDTSSETDQAQTRNTGSEDVVNDYCHRSPNFRDQHRDDAPQPQNGADDQYETESDVSFTRAEDAEFQNVPEENLTCQEIPQYKMLSFESAGRRRGEDTRRTVVDGYASVVIGEKDQLPNPLVTHHDGKGNPTTSHRQILNGDMSVPQHVENVHCSYRQTERAQGYDSSRGAEEYLSAFDLDDVSDRTAAYSLNDLDANNKFFTPVDVDGPSSPRIFSTISTRSGQIQRNRVSSFRSAGISMSTSNNTTTNPSFNSDPTAVSTNAQMKTVHQCDADHQAFDKTKENIDSSCSPVLVPSPKAVAAPQMIIESSRWDAAESPRSAAESLAAASPRMIFVSPLAENIDVNSQSSIEIPRIMLASLRPVGIDKNSRSTIDSPRMAIVHPMPDSSRSVLYSQPADESYDRTADDFNSYSSNSSNKILKKESSFLNSSASNEPGHSVGATPSKNNSDTVHLSRNNTSSNQERVSDSENSTSRSYRGRRQKLQFLRHLDELLSNEQDQQDELIK